MLKTSGKILGISVLTAISVEVVFCYLILPERLAYVESSYTKFPHFWLTDTYKDEWITIKEGKRIVKSNGQSEHSIAFVGDSVTFGNGVNQSNTVPQLVAEQLPEYRVQNYGVPGYGLLEYEQVIEQRLKDGENKYIVITLVGNDVYPAAADRLPILIRSGETIVYWNEFEGGLTGYVKLALFKYFKVGYYIALKLREFSTFSVGRKFAVSQISGNDCATKLQAVNKSWNYIYDRHRIIYSNDRVKTALTTAIGKIAAAIRRKGSEPLFVMHYYLGDLESGALEMRTAMKNAVAASQSRILDLYKLHKSLYSAHECEYFSDPGHPGVLQNIMTAKYISGLIKMMEKKE